MISEATIVALESRGLEYILGVRERNTKEVREAVLADRTPGVPLIIPRKGRADTELEAKAVTVGDRRYIVCRNLNEAREDARTREAVVAMLRAKLREGDKALVGNSAYRRYLKTPDAKHFTIDEARVAEDARYDGLYVLRTNTTPDPLHAMLRYRELLVVERLFRTTKDLLATRPIYHQTDAAISRPCVLQFSCAGNKVTRRWALRGTRPSAPHDQRTASTYIFGAICPKEGKAVGLILPWCNTATMSLQLAAISADVAPGRHAVLLLDQAGWHLSQKLVVPSNITIVPLPAKCPELNPQENVWQFMLDNWLSNRVFENARALVDHCCHAWNKLEAQPWLIMSIGMRGWAHRF